MAIPKASSAHEKFQNPGRRYNGDQGPAGGRAGKSGDDDGTGASSMTSAINRATQRDDLNAWNQIIIGHGGTGIDIPSRANLPPQTVAGLLSDLVTQALMIGGTGLVDIPVTVDNRRFGELQAGINRLIASLDMAMAMWAAPQSFFETPAQFEPPAEPAPPEEPEELAQPEEASATLVGASTLAADGLVQNFAAATIAGAGAITVDATVRAGGFRGALQRLGVWLGSRVFTVRQVAWAWMTSCATICSFISDGEIFKEMRMPHHQFDSSKARVQPYAKIIKVDLVSAFLFNPVDRSPCLSQGNPVIATF
jgi:hypothetical protein